MKPAGGAATGWSTLLANPQGVPLKVVQELLGHSSIKTTERYAHLAPSMHIDLSLVNCGEILPRWLLSKTSARDDRPREALWSPDPGDFAGR